ncbi:hypothetical protein [Pectobacterium polaris]|nr:hypothetical protein [Pectobacterium polaris]
MMSICITQRYITVYGYLLTLCGSTIDESSIQFYDITDNGSDVS